MTNKIRNRVTLILMALIIFGGTLVFIISPDKDHSSSERRKLKQFPEFTAESIFSGRFMSNFESYTQDQFPAREFFRGIKAFTALNIFQQQDNNSVYGAEGHLSTLDLGLDEDSVLWAADRINNVKKLWLEDNGSRIFYSVIPDKNYFLAEQNGYPAMDYDRLLEIMDTELDMEYIDIFPTLGLDDFYLTDSHWKQEELTDTADTLLSAMGGEKLPGHEVITATEEFYGVYAGQYALPVKAEKIRCLRNEATDKFTVFDHENGKDIPLYDMEAAFGEDPYELFTGGPLSIVTIENPTAKTEKELIVFRDSFGSSIAPLLAESYSKVTLVDIRYIRSDLLGEFVEFGDSDVLFLYSSSVLNSSGTMK